ncbi:GcrA family cell cycle regulator [Hyphomicrobium sp.]|uniref:GcrA family cell cycle regulator n=1 Tax=Hyphomicrobium sp. TaxID=82 RepID=UPI0025B8195D|nr:GcrA family cell cycle regulator [Hyphomicrobium sp.]MCC7253838.1 hypothetical protein [Hyphomicrobium sp.]
MAWSDEAIATVKMMWDEGRSASEIGAHFNVSRNAVIGVIFRKGWQRGGAQGAREGGRKCAAQMRAETGARTVNLRERLKRYAVAPTRLPRKPGLPPLQFAPLVPSAEPEAPRFGPGVPLLECRGCRFAVSPHDAATHLFCDAPKLDGYSYCLVHCAVAFRLPEKARTAA